MGTSGRTSGLLRGAAAGAAGTTALNAVTYLDMAVRGRPSSETPEQMIETMAQKTGVSVPGQGEQRDNRLAGLGPLFGVGVGVVVGALVGVVHSAVHARGKDLPGPAAIALIALGAMATSDVPLKLFGVSDPSDWGAVDWAADVVPHLAYGAVTYATLRATDD